MALPRPADAYHQTLTTLRKIQIATGGVTVPLPSFPNPPPTNAPRLILESLLQLQQQPPLQKKAEEFKIPIPANTTASLTHVQEWSKTHRFAAAGSVSDVMRHLKKDGSNIAEINTRLNEAFPLSKEMNEAKEFAKIIDFLREQRNRFPQFPDFFPLIRANSQSTGYEQFSKEDIIGVLHTFKDHFNVSFLEKIYQNTWKEHEQSKRHVQSLEDAHVNWRLAQSLQPIIHYIHTYGHRLQPASLLLRLKGAFNSFANVLVYQPESLEEVSYKQNAERNIEMGATNIVATLAKLLETETAGLLFKLDDIDVGGFFDFPLPDAALMTLHKYLSEDEIPEKQTLNKVKTAIDKIIDDIASQRKTDRSHIEDAFLKKKFDRAPKYKLLIMIYMALKDYDPNYPQTIETILPNLDLLTIPSPGPQKRLC